jgi:hypothetical protein
MSKTPKSVVAALIVRRSHQSFHAPPRSRSSTNSHGQSPAQGRSAQVGAPPHDAAHGSAINDRVPTRHDRCADGSAREPRAAASTRRTGPHRGPAAITTSHSTPGSSSAASASLRASTSGSTFLAIRSRSRFKVCVASSSRTSNRRSRTRSPRSRARRRRHQKQPSWMTSSLVSCRRPRRSLSSSIGSRMRYQRS